MKKMIYLCALGLSGCMVGPNYVAPKSDMPSAFVEVDRTQQSASNEATTCWWKMQFNDPFLDELIAQALQANYDFRISLEQIIQARSQYRIQASYLWPEFDLAAVAVRSRNSQTLFPSTTGSTTGAGSILPTFQNFFQVGFDAIWEFDLFGKFRRGKRAAAYDWEASKENAQDVLISVVSEVARDYTLICALQQEIKLITRKVRIDEELLKLVAALFAAGLGSDIDVQTARATLESDHAQLPPLETAYKQAIYALAVVLGQQPESLICSFEDKRPIPVGKEKVPVGLPSDLLQRRPDIKRAERQLAAASERIGVAVADLFPHVSLTGVTFAGGQQTGSGYGYETGKISDWFKHASRAWSVGPAVRWDLIDFGRTRGNIDVYKSQYRQQLLSYEHSVIAALQDVEGALIAYFEEQKRQLFFEDQVMAVREALRLTEDLYSAGLVSDTQVLSESIQLLNAEYALTQSQQALAIDLIALYKALGGSWACSYTP